jgi:hypothetical protein
MSMKFLCTYQMPVDFQPGSPDRMTAWNEWFEGIGAGVEDPGNPTFESGSVGNCGATTKLGGYSIITADDLESALSLTKGCPVLADGGGIVVGAITEIYDGAA